MEALFGTHLVKFKKSEEPPKEENADTPDEEGQEEKPKYAGLKPYSEEVPIDQVFNHADDSPLRYVGVVFSADYCPPCQKLLEPMKEFYQEFSKDGAF